MLEVDFLNLSDLSLFKRPIKDGNVHGISCRASKIPKVLCKFFRFLLNLVFLLM